MSNVLRRVSAFVFAMIFSCSSVLPGAATGTVNPALLAQFGGKITVAQVSGSFLYAGIGSRLSIFDVENPAQPVARGEIVLPGKVNDLAVDGNHVFLALDKVGLWAVNASNPLSPTVAGVHSFSSGAAKVRVKDAIAYVASGSDLWQVTVSDPSNMQVGLNYNGGTASFIDLAGFVGNHLIAAMSDGVRSIDTATLTQAGVVNSAAVTTAEVNGNFVYVSVNNGGTKVVDATNPAALVEGAGFAPSAQNGIVRVGTHLFVSTFSTVNIYTLADPANPAFVTLFNPPGGSSLSFAGNGSRLYLANNQNGFDIFDTTNVNNLQLLGTRSLPGFAYEAVPVGAITYALNGGALYTLNNVARSTPGILGVLKDPNNATFGAIAVNGSLAYLLRGFQGMSVVSVADPANPTILGSLDYSGPNSDITVRGTLVYVADGPNGLRVIDVADSAAPKQVGSLASTGFSAQVVVNGAYAYVADSNAGLRVVNISDPAAPQESGIYQPGGSVVAIALVGNSQVLIGVDGVGLELVDVSNPAAPARLAEAAVLTQIASVAVSFGTAYALGRATGPSGLDTVLVTLNLSPASLTQTDSRAVNEMGQIGLGNSHLLLALGSDGLSFYTNPNAPSFTHAVYIPLTTKN